MYVPTFTNLPSGSNPVQISVGREHTCAVMNNGSLYCWGYNGNQQSEGPVNDVRGSYIYNPSYVETKFGHRVVSVGVGEGYTCALTEHAGGIMLGPPAMRGH